MPDRISRVKPQGVSPAAQLREQPAHPLDGRGGLPATSSHQRFAGSDSLPHQRIKKPLLVGPGPVGLCGRGQLGIGKLAVNHVDAGRDVRTGRGQRVPADGDLLQRVKHHVRRVGLGQGDHGPGTEQRGDLISRLYRRAVGGHDLKVEV